MGLKSVHFWIPGQNTDSVNLKEGGTFVFFTNAFGTAMQEALYLALRNTGLV